MFCPENTISFFVSLCIRVWNASYFIDVSCFRMKREVASTIVEKGVNERIRLTQIYEKKKDELCRQHQEVQNHVEEERTRVSAV